MESTVDWLEIRVPLNPVFPYEISIGGERNLLLFIVQYMYLNWPSRILQFFKLDFEEHFNIILICTKDSTLVQLAGYF